MNTFNKYSLQLIVLLIIVMTTSCSNNNSNTSNRISKPVLEMYVFDVGEILVNDISQLNGGNQVKAAVTFSNTAFLIRHPQGDLIWDTGFADSTVNHPLGEPTSAFYSTMSKTLSGQLKEIRVDPKAIKYLAVSHKHPDHTGNMNLFAESAVILQEAEYQALFESEEPGIELDQLLDNEFVKLNGSFDVFGDSSVVVIPTPGHTSGHQVLYVDLPETGPIVLSGDLWLFNVGITSQKTPLFNEDTIQTAHSWKKIKALLSEKNATLWVQHDQEQMMKIPRSPQVIK